MNNSKSDTSSQRSLDKKSAKRWAIGWTVIYLILFPVFFYAAMFSFMVFDGPRITIPIGLSIIFTWFWTPLSMPIAIYLIWKSYSRSEYKQMYLYCAVPFFTWFWTPLSMPIAIYLIWKSYSRSEYKQMYLYCAVPFFTFGTFILVNALIDTLLL